MKAVSDAGPLIALGKLGQLGLLIKVYDEVNIAPAVYREVVINGRRLAAPEAESVDFLVKQGHIHVIDIELQRSKASWTEAIDEGEIETILLAQKQTNTVALIDDSSARRAARLAGVGTRGTVGIVLQAFRQQYVSLPELELLIQRIKTQPDLWISDRICDEVLAQARRAAKQQ